ncbi:MAG: response regulator transcription factor [Anaerolineales bacterium]|nr:response regulator transcription factor [Anaerolineales bacterium]
MDTAVSLLARALALAEPEGYYQLFVDEGAALAALLQALLLAESGQAAYIRRLLAALGVDSAEKSANALLIDPLSERELEILALIVAGRKNKEIAEELIISVNTVLYHTKNIYGKLGVNKRALAIAKVRELGLLG